MGAARLILAGKRIRGVLCGLEGLVFGEVKSQVHCKASVVATGEIETHHQDGTCEEIGDDKKKKKVGCNAENERNACD